MAIVVQAGKVLLVEDWPLPEVVDLREIVGLLEVVEVVALLQAAKAVELLRSQ